MLRTPRAWAPSSSDSSAIRLRSRVVVWTRHSRSRSCWMPKATARAPIRTRAMAESDTLTRSTPEDWRRRAASIVRSMRTLRGGSISTETTNRPAARAWPSREPRSGRSSPVGPASANAVRGMAPETTEECWAAPAWLVLRRVSRLRRLDHAAVERGAHRRDVGRGRPAAATDDPGTGVEQPRDDRAEPRRLGRVHELPVEALGKAGVGHDRARRVTVARLAEALQRVEAGHRARRRS